MIGLNEVETTLRSDSASTEDKILALKFLVHLVGDIHQPLHVGRKADKGGNGVRVKYYGRTTNLHAVWDGAMIEQEKLTYLEFTKLLDNATPEEIKDWQSTGYEAWAQENMEYRAGVYDLLVDAETYDKTQDFLVESQESDSHSHGWQHMDDFFLYGEHTSGRSRNPHRSDLPRLGDLYRTKNMDIVKTRLRMAGFRLAGVLNSIFQ